jgi:gliding motility-associated lipoprotein GldH
MNRVPTIGQAVTKSKNVSKFVAFVWLVFFSACDSSVVYEENHKIEDNNWSAEKPMTFLAVIDDTTSAHNVYINLRNASHYPFSNIFLFLNTTFPGGELDRDTLEIMLATPDGKWLGEGLGDIWDNRVLFKKNVSFPQKGEYRFEFTQAMRLNPLPGVMDVGIRIEKSK